MFGAMAKNAMRGWRAAAWGGTLDRPGSPALRASGRRRLSGGRWRARLGWLLALSVLLHVAVLVVVLYAPEPQTARNVGDTADVDVVMLPAGTPEAPTLPEPVANPTTPERAMQAQPPTEAEPAPAAPALPIPIPPPPPPEPVPAPPLPRPPPPPPATAAPGGCASVLSTAGGAVAGRSGAGQPGAGAALAA